MSNYGTWHNHIELIKTKAWSSINMMYKLKFQFDCKTLEIIYFTFIRPLLECADVVWDNCTPFDQTESEKVQLEADRIVSGTTKLVSLASLFNELGWEELSSRRRKHKLFVRLFGLCLFRFVGFLFLLGSGKGCGLWLWYSLDFSLTFFVLFYKMISNFSSNYLTQLVPDQVGQAFSCSLRNAENLQNIHADTQLYYKSFLPSVVRDWNALPVFLFQETLPH